MLGEERLLRTRHGFFIDMPTRSIRDYTDSDRVNQLSWQAEVFFVRLMLKADDFGRFHANPKLLKSALFPHRVDEIKDKHVIDWISECTAAGLIVCYTVKEKNYLYIKNFCQRLRLMQSKFPEPPQSAGKCPSNDGQLTDNRPPEEKRREEEEEVEEEEEEEVEEEGQKIVFAEVYPSFNDIWQAYDLKVGKDKAEKSWKKMNQTERELAMKKVPDYIASLKDRQYQAHLSTWLNGRRWEDEFNAIKKPLSRTFKDEQDLAAFLAIRPDN